MQEQICVGWREYLSLPELNIQKIKAKIDTGARSSCLHAFNIEPFNNNNEEWVRFWVHPEQDNKLVTQKCEAKLVDQRVVKDSGGHEELRFVIKTLIKISKDQWPVEITLSNRENMRFRMLLGRTAMKNIVVKPSASFLTTSEK